MARRDTLIDSAKGNFFLVENALIDRFGQQLKAPGLAVYTALKRHANSRSGETYVGVEKIGAALHLSKRSTYRYLAQLEDLKLIRILRLKERTIYYVLPVPRTSPQTEIGPLFEDVPPATLSATSDTQCHQWHEVVTPVAQSCATGVTRNKEEQDLFNKTALTRGEEPAPDLPPLALARGLLERIQLPVTTWNMNAVASAIEAIQKQRGDASARDSCDWLEWRVAAAREAGAKVSRFWFEDGSYNDLKAGVKGNATDQLKNRYNRELEINASE